MRPWLSVLCLVLMPAVALAQAVVPPPPTGKNVPLTVPENLGRPPADTQLQKQANDFAYPTEPWNPTTRPVTRGQVIRYIAVPPQDVIVAVAAPSAETAPFELQDTVVTIPGYYITETTTGYVYPVRWTLDQLNVGVYQWRLLPAEFRQK